METIKVNMNPNPLDVQTIHASQNDGEARQWEFQLHNNGELIDTSEITEQLFFKSYKGGTEQILPENTSTPTTSPFKGDIKYPQGLLSDQEFTYRQSPTEEDGLAKITDVKGNTLVWNQHSDTITAGTASKGLTMSRKTGVDVPTLHIEGTYNYVSGDDVNFYFGWAVSRPKFAIGHKILVSTTMKNFGVGTYTATPITYTGEKSALVTITQDGYLNLLFRCKLPNGSAINEDFTVNVFDLTQMGLDSITSADEFTSLFPKPYYDYCQGAILSFGGRNVKFNQLVEISIYSTVTTSGLTVTNNRDGSYKITGTANDLPINFWINGQYNVSDTLFTLVSGHKYLIKQCIMFSVTTRVSSEYYLNDDPIVYTATANTNITGIRMPYARVGTTYNTNVWPMIIDLSEMFGVGNEPSAKGFLEIFTSDYYEYTTEKYMNIGQPVSLKTIGKNLFKPKATFTNNGITFTNDNGVITISGTATANAFFTTTVGLRNASYFIGAFNDEINVNVHVAVQNKSGQYVLDTVMSVKNRTISLNNDINNFIIWVNSGGTLNNFVLKPMVSFDSPEYFEPYTENTANLPISTYFPNGMKSAGNVYDELTEAKAITRVGSRAYQSGDESDTSVITDGTTTYYALATPTETSFTTASLVTENAEIPLSNNDGVLIGKCTEELSAEPGFHDAKIKLSDSDGTCYSNKLQLHVERSPQ